MSKENNKIVITKLFISDYNTAVQQYRPQIEAFKINHQISLFNSDFRDGSSHRSVLNVLLDYINGVRQYMPITHYPILDQLKTRVLALLDKIPPA